MQTSPPHNRHPLPSLPAQPSTHVTPAPPSVQPAPYLSERTNWAAPENACQPVPPRMSPHAHLTLLLPGKRAPLEQARVAAEAGRSVRHNEPTPVDVVGACVP